MPLEDTKTLEFNQYQSVFIICADFEYLNSKIDGCKNNPDNSSLTKVNELFHQVFRCL